jgi:hypothetical protein
MNIPLLQSRASSTTGNDGSEDVTLHGNTQGQRNDIKEEEVGSLSGGSLARQNT